MAGFYHGFQCRISNFTYMVIQILYARTEQTKLWGKKYTRVNAMHKRKMSAVMFEQNTLLANDELKNVMGKWCK